MGVVVKYVQKRGGRYVYRRAVPKHLREVLGRSEEVRKLGGSHAEMMRMYGAVHAEVERLFNGTHASSAINSTRNWDANTDLDRFNQAIDRIQSMGWSAELVHADETEREHRQITRELELEKYHQNKHGGYEGVPPEEAAFIRALTFDKTPEPTLLDAKEIYVKDKIAGTARERQNLLRVDFHRELTR